jgi:syntaxin 6
MAASNPDPFPAARDHVKGIVERCSKNHKRYVDIIMNQDTSVNTEYKDLRTEIGKDIRAASSAIKLLKESVEKLDPVQMQKFKISEAELTERKTFVDKAEKVLNKVKLGLDTEPIRKKLNADQAKRKREAQDETQQALQSEINADNENFVRDQKRQVQQTIKVQDQALGGLEQSLVNLHGRAKVINTELKEQDKMLDDLKGDVDKANDRILTVNEALGKLLNTKDGCQIWTVVILFVILVILVALVIWT